MLTNDGVEERQGIRVGQQVDFRFGRGGNARGYSGTVQRLAITKALIRFDPPDEDRVAYVSYRQIMQSTVGSGDR